MFAAAHATRREYPSDIAFTPALKAIQNQKGSRGNYARMERGEGPQASITPDLAKHIADLDMFYLGTANAEGAAVHPVPRRLAWLPQGARRTDLGVR